MSTRPLKLVKGDETVTLTEQAHIDAYVAKGWKVAKQSGKKKKEG